MRLSRIQSVRGVTYGVRKGGAAMRRVVHLGLFFFGLLQLASAGSAAVYVNRDYYWDQFEQVWKYNIVDRHIGVGSSVTWNTDSDFGLQGTGSPYILEADVYVDYNPDTQQKGTLNIGAGVVVRVPASRGIYVNGTLNAQGNPSSRIVFTSTTGTQPGSWDCLFFWGEGSSGSVLRYCDIQYAGREASVYKNGAWHITNGAVSIWNSAPVLDHLNITTAAHGIRSSGSSQATISNCLIQNCQYGIQVVDTSYYQPYGPQPPIRNNVIGNCTYAGYTTIQAAGAFDSTNQVTGNTCNAFFVFGGSVQNASAMRRMNGAPAWVINTSNPVVPEGTSLVLSPGVVLKFDVGRALYVLGNLNATGSPSQKIVVTSLRDDSAGGDANGDGASTLPQKGDWGSIVFSGTGSSASQLSYCDLAYGGNGASVYETIGWNNHHANLVFYHGASPSISNTLSRMSLNDGAFLNYGSRPSFTGCQFTENASYAIRCDEIESNPVISGCSASGNGINAVNIRGGVITDTRTWYKSIPYYVENSVDIAASATLNIQPGVAVKMAPGKALNINGSVQALGTSTEPIYFTSIKDDIYGDTNADGSATSPAPGDWLDLFIYGSSASSTTLRNCVVRYGGPGGNYYVLNVWHSAMGNVHVKDSEPTIENSRLERSANHALQLTGASNPTVNNCFLSDSPWGVVIENSSYYANPTQQRFFVNTITRNGTAGYVSPQSLTQFAANNTITANTSNSIHVYGGAINSQGIWRRMLGTSTLLLVGAVDVPSGTTLDITQGNVIKVNPGVQLNAMGRLTVDGSLGQPVVFTSRADDSVDGDTNVDGSASSPGRGDWAGILFFGPGASESVLRNCDVRYASSGANLYHGSMGWVHYKGNVTAVNSSPILSAVRLKEGADCGFALFGSSRPAFSQVIATNNSSYAGWMSVGSNAAISACSASGNGANGILLESGTIDDTRTWYASIPYVISGSLTLGASANLTINPGGVVKFHDNGIMGVNGNLQAVSPDLAPPVVFTAFSDDSAGGDTNGDQAASQPQKGSWHGVVLWGDPASASRFRNCHFRYGGSGAHIYYGPGWFYNWGIATVVGSAPEFEKCRFTDSVHAGLYAGGGSRPVVRNSHFESNDHWGLYAESAFPEPSAQPEITGNIFAGNAMAALVNIATALHMASDNQMNGNTRNVVAFHVGSFPYSGRLNNFQSETGCPYYLNGQYRIPGGVQISLQEGVVLKFEENSSLGVTGTLLSEGTLEKRVVLTSVKDDSVGGDSNADGNATSPVPGSWRGMVLLPGHQTTNLSNMVIRYGGNATHDYSFDIWWQSWGNVTVLGSGASFDYCEFSFSNYEGASVSATNTSFNNCTFARNGRIGVHALPSSVLYIRNSISSGNQYAAAQEDTAGGGRIYPGYSDFHGPYYHQVYYQSSGWQWESWLPQGLGNINVDPLFVNANLGDFRLQAYSPCINTGDPDLTDPDGSRRDMGAYPYFGPFDIGRIGLIKTLPDGEPVVVAGKIVTAGTAELQDRIYIEDLDRAGGILVIGNLPTQMGNLVNVSGVLATIEGERAIINADVVLVSSSGNIPLPLSMNLASLGGMSLNAYTPGVTGSRGVYNLGLLVTVFGKVTSTATGAFWVNDGANREAEGGRLGVKVLSSQPVSIGSMIKVTGISGAYLDGSTVRSVVRTRMLDDVLPLD